MTDSIEPTYVEDNFKRDTRYITTRITADGADGWPVESGRYRLVVARACPWAHRLVITRRLTGLDQAISMGLCGPTHDARSWTFDLDPGGVDPVLGFERLQQAYFESHPDYPRGITVPALVDIPSRGVVTNDFRQMEIDLSIEWSDLHRDNAPDLYPESHRVEIDEMSELIYRDVNNAVYKSGFAGTQAAHNEAFARLFARLDWLEDHLKTHRYLVGDTITQADIRLWVTLVRFDSVYHGHFKCNRSKLTEMPTLWAYARDLFQTPGFGDTTDFTQIKSHYYEVHRDINPSGVIPSGPDLSNWADPQDRESLGGRPFGDGSPPGPPSPAIPETSNPALYA